MKAHHSSLRRHSVASLTQAIGPVLASAGFRQLLRFLVAGMAVTLFSAAIYAWVAMLGMLPLAANLISHGCGMVAGYQVHSRWSFNADTAGRERATILRFLLASGISFLLNSLWVWLAVDRLGLTPLAPLPAMIVLTPLMSFALNRYWVFRAA